MENAVNNESIAPGAEQMSKVIWEWAFSDKCYHDMLLHLYGRQQCRKCFEMLPECQTANIDLTLDTNLGLLRVAEMKGIEVFGELRYTVALTESLHRDSPYGRELTRAAMASAAQRSLALYNIIMGAE